MPYFIYNITYHPVTQVKKLQYIDTKERFQEARLLVREKRTNMIGETNMEYRLIFAANQAEAEKLLSTPREERVIGED